MLVQYLHKYPWQEQDLGGKRPDKSVCIVRYGGFGDMIQMSSVLPYLKEQGYYITVNTSDRGYHIIQNDPLIDECFVQITDQVPNQELSQYWAALAKNFDRFIQFSESIEGKLLALPGRPEYKWRNQKRHQKMNRDYFAQMHRIANVPLPPRPLFCPTDKEIDRAEKFLPDGFNIMWSLSGSSVHKAWPYTDQVIAQLLMDTDVNIIFVGDELCKLLEDAWENEPRVYQTCGEMDIRDTLTLTRLVDMVVGPETGVLNCVAFEEIPKVLMLSHSSPVNIGGTWTNTEVITPRGVDCYPCHKLHYSFDTCNRDENTGGAMCAANIKPERVYKAITKHIREIA